MKEVPEEVTMVEEVDEIGHEEEVKIDEQCFFAVMEKTVEPLRQSLARRTGTAGSNTMAVSRPTSAVVRQFKFGGGETRPCNHSSCSWTMSTCDRLRCARCHTVLACQTHFGRVGSGPRLQEWNDANRIF